MYVCVCTCACAGTSVLSPVTECDIIKYSTLLLIIKIRNGSRLEGNKTTDKIFESNWKVSTNWEKIAKWFSMEIKRSD